MMRGVNAKGFYLLLYSIALRTFSLSPLNAFYRTSGNSRHVKHKNGNVRKMLASTRLCPLTTNFKFQQLASPINKISNTMLKQYQRGIKFYYYY